MPCRHVFPRPPRRRTLRQSPAASTEGGGAARGRSLRVASAVVAIAAVGTLAASRAGGDAATPAAVRVDPSPTSSSAVNQALVDRAQRVKTLTSRSSLRPPSVAAQRATKVAALPVSRQRLTRGLSRTVAPSSPRAIALVMLGDFGWSSDQFSCLDQLWVSESNWNPYAENSSSSAYGIPQALPGSKMSSAGADWRSNPVTQIRWGLEYIRSSYGTPCGAWYFKLGHSWY